MLVLCLVGDKNKKSERKIVTKTMTLNLVQKKQTNYVLSSVVVYKYLNNEFSKVETKKERNVN